MGETAVQSPQPLTPQFREARSPAMLSPSVDFLMIGGASLLMFALAYLFVDKKESTNQISWAAFYLAMAVNNPHFMASYLLLYWDKRRELFSNKRFLWAAVLAPAAVLAYIVGSIAFESPRYLSYAVNFMYFLVGWHYIKQIYGTIIVTSVRHGYFFSKKESWALKLNLFPVWFMSYFNGNGSIRELLHYGVGYKTFAIPEIARTLNYVFLGASLVALGYLLFRKWVREGKLPSWTSAASFAAIYIWYLPNLYHAHFWYLIPLFHSLQYMLFVTTLKKNQYAADAAAASPTDDAGRRLAFAKRFFGFGAIITVMAMATFHWLPNTLDNYVPYNETLFGKELFMFCFITFINIHHYFIDNVIWRRDNPALKQHLFS